MIVSSRRGSLVLVKQVDHARLAGDFARLWGNNLFEPLARRSEVTLATDQHDLGWKEPDESVLYSEQTRKPLNFYELSFAAHRRLYRPGVEAVLAQDSYAGLLVSMHWIGLYTGRLGYLPEMPGPNYGTDSSPADLDALVEEQTSDWAGIRRGLWQRELDRPLGDLEQQIWTHYALLQFWDRLSVFACLNDLAEPTGTRLGQVPLSAAGVRTEVRVTARGDETLELDPYPLARSGVELTVPMKRIPDQPYASHAALAQTVQAAREEELVFRLVSPS